ncbi:tumor necrosis factor receptor superfamily member 5 isoform X1 [Syngnathus acus]|uniref:tumor necrosis factor receptor superfamily member 5 isoform X1 n=1 Tax=Syngnathus acus TaxID=161584 RepID=UPI001885BD03|nr:tumor necrosis factor receptor superfamily member 5 isoform X1 [Syngnathus acus]
MDLKVQYLLSVLLASARLLLTLPLTERNVLSVQRAALGTSCKMCPAGQYQKSCEQCAPCPAGYYTTDRNREGSCHRCYGDCRPEFNQRVLANCSSTSNLKCTCQDGFRCTAEVAYSDNCKNCVATTTVTWTTMRTKTTAPNEEENSPSSSPSGDGSHSASSFHKNDGLPGSSSHTNKEDRGGPWLVNIVLPMVVVVTVALVVLLCNRRSGEGTYLKRAVIKLCNKSAPNDAGKEKESTQPFPIDPCGAVHVHNAGTVIVSWLSQFTGPVGPVMEKKDDNNEEETEDAPPPVSPSVPLSEEERTSEAIFFPSQEEGKDWHVSKEEAEA